MKQKEAAEGMLEKEQRALQLSMANAPGNSRTDALWKKRVLELKAQLDQAKQENDMYQKLLRKNRIR